MRYFIYPYSQPSRSARALAEAIQGRRIRREGSRYNHRPDNHLVVNWGASDCPDFENMLNKPEAVRRASSKLETFNRLGSVGVPIPHFTTDRQMAEMYMDNGDWEVCYCRTLTRANSGRGIVVANSVEEVVDAPLYVKGITGGRREYRVHVFEGEVIRLQQKKRRTETAGDGYEANNEVRNLAGGWVFTSEDITPIVDGAEQSAVDAVQALGLDFGAVDVITQRGQHWILEVNTACGLEGSTLEAYAEAIERHSFNTATTGEELTPSERWRHIVARGVIREENGELVGEVSSNDDWFHPEQAPWEPEPQLPPVYSTANLTEEDVGRRFVIPNSFGGVFSEGSVVELEGYGGSAAPLFKLIAGSCVFNNAAGGAAGGWYEGDIIREGQGTTTAPSQQLSPQELF